LRPISGRFVANPSRAGLDHSLQVDGDPLASLDVLRRVTERIGELSGPDRLAESSTEGDRSRWGWSRNRTYFSRNVPNPSHVPSMPGRNARVGYVRYEAAAAEQAAAALLRRVVPCHLPQRP
jgi:hypothetical protein